MIDWINEGPHVMGTHSVLTRFFEAKTNKTFRVLTSPPLRAQIDVFITLTEALSLQTKSPAQFLGFV